MRLLKRERIGWLRTTNEFSLVNFRPPDIPQYAILSHRWDSDEVVFQDLGESTAKSKDGYKKLEFCAQQATRDGLTYFWIDTCCIDKTNNTELSEAINSMFKWYKNAAKCYVYLSDVSAKPEWESAFENSKWFRRGWTLQELIAPDMVEFFSVEGTKLGDKKSLEEHIHRITGISIEALQGKSLSEIDEKHRFSWTARRTTTIEEDAAYCLLGIFDVHIPLIYGEGQQKALARLRREIQQSSNSTPQILEDAAWIVPFERNSRFSGRDSQLAELEELVFQQDHTTKIAVTGLGGVGKTQLVLELLHRVRERHQDCSIMWIPATTFENIEQGHLAIAQHLRLLEHEDESPNVKKLVQDYLSRETSGQWLLVFDNADDISLWTAVPAQECRDMGLKPQDPMSESQRLLDYLPRSRRGCIIFTTRDRRAAVKFAQEKIIVVSEMGEEIATQLLEKSLADRGLMSDVRNVTALLEALTYLPLAITQATAYINANGLTIADYISLLEEKEEQIIEVLSEDFEDYGRYQNGKNPVATTWLISFEQIQLSNPLAAEYLSLMACIDPRNIPQSLLPQGSSRKSQIEAIGTLTAHSFVSRRPAGAALDLHRLVHLAMRNWLRKEGLLSQWMLRTIRHLAEVFPDHHRENRTTWRMYLPHASQVLTCDLVHGDSWHRIALLRKCGQCLLMDGRWNEAEAMFKEVLATRRIKSEEESHTTLKSTSWLALTYIYQGRLEEAEQLLLQVISARKTNLGPEHPDTLTSTANLAVTYTHQGRFMEAEQLHLQVAEARKSKFGADHKDTLTSMADLAVTYADQCRFVDAEQLYLEVIDSRKRKLGASHQDTLTSMANLAVMYGDQGRLDEAERLHLDVLDIRKKELGADHQDTLISICDLAVTYTCQGRLRKAEEMGLKVVETCKAKLGVDHPDTLMSMTGLAMTYMYQGRWEEEEQLNMQVFETRRTKLRPDHPDTLTSMSNLAMTWKRLGQEADAIDLMRDCVTHRIHVSGATHPHTLSSQEVLKMWEAESLNTRTKHRGAEDIN